MENRQLMKALNQLCGATGDFIMGDDSNDCPPSLNSPSSTGSDYPPPLCSPLSFRQLRAVPNKSDNDERQSKYAMGVQGGGGDAIKDDHSELTPFPDAGDLLNACSFFLPGTRRLASPLFGIGFCCWCSCGRLCHARR